MLNFLSFGVEKSLAQRLVTELTKSLPADKVTQRGRGVSVSKVTKVLEGIYAVASSFQQERGIGFLGRAVLANDFKWRLKEAGYPDDFIRVAVEGLVVSVTKKR